MSETPAAGSAGVAPPGVGAPAGAPPAQDPLAALRDIHLPPAVEAWPPAPGWWGLGLLALGALLVLSIWAGRRWRATRYRRTGLAELRELRNRWEQNAADARLLPDLATLLKRVALSAWPRQEVAGLSGERWVRFLDDTLQTREFSMGAGQVLIHGPYQSSSRLDPELLTLAERWIRRHRVQAVQVPPAYDEASHA